MSNGLMKYQSYMQDEYEMYKIVMIGSSATGKTSISNRFVRDVFLQAHQNKAGVDFLTKLVEVDSKTIKIALWDTAGQEKYRSLSKIYYKGASGVIIIYDVTDAKTYLEVETWMRLVNQNLNVDEVIIMLVGNKVDCEDQRQVSTQRPLEEFQKNFDIDCWQVSAKTGYKIQQLFRHMIDKILQREKEASKDTVYKGTAYYESEQSSVIRPSEPKQPSGYLSSIIVEEEEENKSPHRRQDLQVVNNSLILTVSSHKQILQKNKSKKQKKCC